MNSNWSRLLRQAAVIFMVPSLNRKVHHKMSVLPQFLSIPMIMTLIKFQFMSLVLCRFSTFINILIKNLILKYVEWLILVIFIISFQKPLSIKFWENSIKHYLYQNSRDISVNTCYWTFLLSYSFQSTNIKKIISIIH